MVKLKNCPFCGNDEINIWQSPNRKYNGEGWFIYAQCTLCGARTKPIFGKEEPKAKNWETDAVKQATKYWNRRVTP